MEFLYAFAVGLLILVSFLGWGELLQKIFLQNFKFPWPQNVALGIAFSIAVGGVLNLFSFSFQLFIQIYALLGAVIGFYFVFASFRIKHLIQKEQKLYNSDKVYLIITVIFWCFAALCYTAFVFTKLSNFNYGDDLQGYLVFPYKMLQTGSIGIDPFSERRMTSSLGGQAFLQAIALSFLNIENIKIIDRGIGIILITAFLLLILKSRKATSYIDILIPLVFFAVVPPELNTTSMLIPFALFLSLFCFLQYCDANKSSNFFLPIGFIASAICLQKASHIPATFLIIFCFYFFKLMREKEVKVISQYFLVSITIILCMAPWMLVMYRSSNTLLYPLLGLGYHGSNYGSLVMPMDHPGRFNYRNWLFPFFKEPLFIFVCLFGIIALYSKNKGSKIIISSFLIATVVSVFGIIIATDIDHIRNVYSFAASCLLLMMTASLVGKYKYPLITRFLTSVLSLAALIYFIFLIPHRDMKAYEYFPKLVQRLVDGLTEYETESMNQKSEYEAIQSAIPAGTRIIQKTVEPYLFDFNRNIIFVFDTPGGASPPPGLPLKSGADAFADYFISQSVRYLIFFPEMCKTHLEKNQEEKGDTWISSSNNGFYFFCKHAIDLYYTRKKLTEARYAVLDLQERVKPREM